MACVLFDVPRSEILCLQGFLLGMCFVGGVRGDLKRVRNYILTRKMELPGRHILSQSTPREWGSRSQRQTFLETPRCLFLAASVARDRDSSKSVVCI